MRSLKYRHGIKNRSLTKYKKRKGKVLRGGVIQSQIKQYLNFKMDTPETNKEIMDYFEKNKNELDELNELELQFILNIYEKEKENPFDDIDIKNLIKDKITEKKQNAPFDKLEILKPVSGFGPVSDSNPFGPNASASANPFGSAPAPGSNPVSAFDSNSGRNSNPDSDRNSGFGSAPVSAPDFANFMDDTYKPSDNHTDNSDLLKFTADYKAKELKIKNEELERVKLELKIKNEELERVKLEPNTKNEELERVKLELESKNEELERVKLELERVKLEELKRVKLEELKLEKEELEPNQVTIKFFKPDFEKTIVANIGNILNSVGLFEVLLKKFNETNVDKKTLLDEILSKIKSYKDALTKFYKELAGTFKIADLKIDQFNMDSAATGAMSANMASYLLATMFFAGLAGGTKTKSMNNFTLKGKLRSKKGKTNKMKMKGGELSEQEIAQIPLLAVNINKDIIQQIYLNIELLKHLKDVKQTTIDDLSNIMTLNQDLYNEVCKTLLRTNCEDPEVFNKTLVSIFIPGSATATTEPMIYVDPINPITLIGGNK